MGETMRPIPFNNLMNWMMEEYKNESKIFGVYSDKFYKAKKDNFMKIFKEKIETPIGPAAGPNGQLAQNLIASYVAGSRFFEVKTVQIMDGADLAACVNRPCILADDEGYNCEWSTELYVSQAFEEYVKAWFALKVISQELGLGDKDGFVFNMSVGYDLAGIKSEKVNNYIEGMKDASNTPIFKECQEWLLANLDKFEKIDADFVKNINPHVSTSITLSTLHGCPPKEIEKIATYLITEKNLNTFIKCNPTLLGYEYARKTVDALGYDYIQFGPLHFQEDMQFEDCVPMIGRLKALCKEKGLDFGVKLTNTFPVDVTRNELPSNEMYMSGRILYPLVMNLAYKLSKEFDGDLRMSMSGGADFYNIDKILNVGIYPITMATTILKPGGYNRLQQIANKLENNLEFKGVDMAALKHLAEESLRDPRHLKARKIGKKDKINAPLPLIDCYEAPCHTACPINQDIPEYVRLVGEGDYVGALKVVTNRNPMPFTTGTICPHRCQNSCTRIFYDESVAIRDAKLKAATEGYDDLIKEVKETAVDKNFKVAVIGAGPAGLAAAYHLRRNGVDVTVFDSKKTIGGIVTNVIPEFRVKNSEVEKDINLVKATGAKFELGVDPNFSIADLKAKGFNYIFLAVGTWKHGDARISGNGVKIVNVLDFLAKFNETNGEAPIGKNVVIVGAGNSAMDAARAAKRTKGVENVHIVYRRTKKYMPADPEELEMALEDGVIFNELLAPIEAKDGVLRCQQMELGAPDVSGRRAPVAVEGKIVEIDADTIVTAIGEKLENEVFAANGIELNDRGYAVVNEKGETSVEGVYVGGDAVKGPRTIVEAMADGMHFAETVVKKEADKALNIEAYCTKANAEQLQQIVDKKGVLVEYSGCANLEANRCLECNTICTNCADVCPNRANIVIEIDNDMFGKRSQIIHVDGMCNECGNCAVFCPYDAAPYKDKLTLYWSEEDFNDSTNAGFLLVGENEFKVRLFDKTSIAKFDANGNTKDIPSGIAALIWATYTKYGYLFNK